MASTEIIDLQPDWNLALREKHPTLWVSYRQNKLAAIEEELLKPAYSGGHVTAISGSASFEVSFNPKQKHRVAVTHTPSKACCEFISPQQSLSVHEKWVHCLDLSPSGDLGVSGSEAGELRIWETGTGAVRRKLSGHLGDVYTCRFYPSGEVVLSGGSDFRLRIWSVIDGSCPRVLSGHTGRITGTQIVERGRNILSASLDGSVRLWECGTASCVALLAQVLMLFYINFVIALISFLIRPTSSLAIVPVSESLPIQ